MTNNPKFNHFWGIIEGNIKKMKMCVIGNKICLSRFGSEHSHHFKVMYIKILALYFLFAN